MNSTIISTEIVSILTYLLPGLVAAATFYALTSHPKPSNFDRVVQAIIFTVLARILADFVPISNFPTSAEPFQTANWRTMIAVLIAIVLGILATIISNRDFLHRYLRKLGVTKETSHPSEWYSAFARKVPRYVVLHLHDQRRLFGWPEEWPGRSDHGHFRLSEPNWLDEKNEPVETNVIDMLIPADQVTMVEFLPQHTTEADD